MPAAHEALAAFGITPGHVRLAWHAENLTFDVSDAKNGARYALRLHRPGHNSLEELESEFVWVQALRDSGIPTPYRRVDPHGMPYVETTAGERRHASLTEWVNGTLLSQVIAEETDLQTQRAHVGALGTLMAMMHNQAAGWRPPPGFTRRSLDMEALIGEASLAALDHHPGLTPDEHALFRSAQLRVREELSAYAADSPDFSMIHADLHLGNIITDGSALFVIDFDDAAWGYHLYEIACGLFPFAHEQYEACESALLERYASLRPLPGAIAFLPAFRVLRGLMLVGWFGQRPKLVSGPAFKALKAFVVAACGHFNLRSRPYA